MATFGEIKRGDAVEVVNPSPKRRHTYEGYRGIVDRVLDGCWATVDFQGFGKPLVVEITCLQLCSLLDVMANDHNG